MKKELALQHLLLFEMRVVAPRLDPHQRTALSELQHSLKTEHRRKGRTYWVAGVVRGTPVELLVSEQQFIFYQRGDGADSDEEPTSDGAAVRNAQAARQTIRQVLALVDVDVPIAAFDDSASHEYRESVDWLGWGIATALAVGTAAGVWWRADSGADVSTTSARQVAEIALLSGALVGLTYTILQAIRLERFQSLVVLVVPAAAAYSSLPVPPEQILALLATLTSLVFVLSYDYRRRGMGRLLLAGVFGGIASTLMPLLGVTHLGICLALLVASSWLEGRAQFAAQVGFLLAAVLGGAMLYLPGRVPSAMFANSAAGSATWLAWMLCIAAVVVGCAYWTVGTHRSAVRMLLPLWIAIVVVVVRQQPVGNLLVPVSSTILLGLVGTTVVYLREWSTVIRTAVVLAGIGLAVLPLAGFVR